MVEAAKPTASNPAGFACLSDSRTGTTSSPICKLGWSARSGAVIEFAPPTMPPPRTRLYADPSGKFLHDLVFMAANTRPDEVAIVDTSTTPPRSITFAEYADMVERIARGLIAANIRPNQVVAIFLPNCWEFAAAFHAISYAGAISTLLNPSYRERE